MKKWKGERKESKGVKWGDREEKREWRKDISEKSE